MKLDPMPHELPAELLEMAASLALAEIGRQMSAEGAREVTR